MRSSTGLTKVLPLLLCHLAYRSRSGLPSANDQDHRARGILRHDMGRRMPLSALAALLVTTLVLWPLRSLCP